MQRLASRLSPSVVRLNRAVPSTSILNSSSLPPPALTTDTKRNFTWMSKNARPVSSTPPTPPPTSPPTSSPTSSPTLESEDVYPGAISRCQWEGAGPFDSYNLPQHTYLPSHSRKKRVLVLCTGGTLTMAPDSTKDGGLAPVEGALTEWMSNMRELQQGAKK